ncbi:hypothetical protein G9A89_003943 [Geosiphon pyriformis]|nr:hypothetical protein G9A89_003943 [Geosiphon pyriformis]
MIEPVGLSTGGFGSVSTDTIYSHNTSYKKPKKSVAGNVIDSSAGPLSLKDISGAGINKVGSITNSVSKISDVKNMANTVAKETSYVKKLTPKHMCWETCQSNSHSTSFNSSKFFVLDIELSAVSAKTVGNKLICVKKIFYHVNGFGRAFTSSKFPEIIRSLFTSESSMNKTKELAICEKIVVNNILKKISSCLDKEIVIKKILVDLSKSAAEFVFSKFGKISSEIADLVAARWSIFMKKDFVCVAKAVDNKQSWISRDLHWVLLYILSVGTTAFDLSDLLESYGGRTCFIGRNSSSYVHDRCVIICFDNKASKLAAIGFVPVFKSVNLQWAGFSLACCTKCKQFGHVSDVCSVGENSGVCGKWMTKELAICEKIVVNNILKKISSCLDKEIVIKKILVDLSKSAAEFVFSKFGKISSEIADLVAARWSIFMKKDFVCVAKAVDNKQSWISRDLHWVLLYILSVGTTAFDLSDLLESYGGRTCFIGRNSSSYVHDRCVIICFDNKASKLAAIGFVPVFKSVNLQWAGFSLACCTKCKQFGHVSDVCSVGENSGVCGKWMVTDHDQAQIVGGFSSLSGFSPSLSAGLSPGTKFYLGAGSSFNSVNSHGVSGLFDCLASMEWFLELLTNQISNIMRKLSFVDLVLLLSVSYELFLAVSASLTPESHLDMVLNGAPEPSAPFFSAVVDGTFGFSSSSSKILTTKMGRLESKLMSLETSISLVLIRLDYLYSGSGFLGLVWKFATCNVRGINVPAKQMDVVCWHISSENTNKYDGVRIFTFGLDIEYLGAGVAVVMNNSLACHISKVKAVPGQSKLLVTVFSLYIGASTGVYLEQMSKINFIIAKTVNTSTFVVLGGNFNKCSFGRSASFKFCSSLGLVNSFNGHYLVKASM